ncbi:MAG: radical SAM protein, partial [Gammaproteobacteria bacterium]|nr:radical SAM protein [Gammaproteobacteria bacterium]
NVHHCSLKILLVLPDGRIHKLKLGSLQTSFREAPLTATMLAALVPQDINADVEIVDESIDSVPFHKDYDLVGISCLTGTSTRAYEIADRFRMQGATVVLGGVHVTLMPDEAKQHGDAIVIGFAEQTWAELLRDFVKDRLQAVYTSNTTNLEHLPHPRRDLQRRFGYMIPNTVFATRGCRRCCDFCTVPAAKFGWHTRPVPEVIDEIRSINARRIALSDVHLTEERAYAKEFFSALIPLNKKWGGLASTHIGTDDELLDLMRQSGCKFLLIGFESINSQSLSKIYKGFNDVE